MLTYVLSADGSLLMPTYNIRKVRQMLKSGRAVIAGHKPGFTIRLACKPIYRRKEDASGVTLVLPEPDASSDPLGS